ncbi:MAG: molecular chaperone [Sphingomonadaceae bacterium]|nr:molecular chaperone [Sphingomonadaceae bacterium]
MHKFSARLAALALLSAAAPALAAGDLLVAPTRVVLDGARGTEVILNNIGAQPATYRISLELRRMTADGRLDDVAPEAANAKETATLAMISYAPRRIVLAPNQPQAIRIGIRPPADLPDGEYRAHMLFRAIPGAAPATATPVREGLSIALTPIYGVTIPIIVRKGSLKAAASLSGVHMVRDKDGPQLAFTLARSGDRSTYGRIRVTRSGIDKPLLEVRGIAAYAEISSRTVALPVDAVVAAKLVGPVKIEYLEDNDAGGGLIAETSAVLR